MRDLTTGPISRHLLTLAGFMSVSFMLATLYLLVDLYWVGKLGAEEIAAVALAGNLYFIVMAIGQVVGVGTTALVSHATGAKDPTEAHYVFNQSCGFGVLLGAGVALGGLAIRPWFFDWLGADALTAQLGRDYLLWFTVAMLAQMATFGLGGALRGIGDLKTPMYLNGFAVGLNILLDPLFIFGVGPFPRMGVAGAALATSLSLTALWILMAIHFTRPGVYLRFHLSQWKPDRRTYARLMKIGLPAGASFGIMTSFMLLIFWAISIFGPQAAAGFGVGQRLLMSLYLPMHAISIANASVVGQNFGARQRSRARLSFYLASVYGGGFMLLLTIVCMTVPKQLIGFFSSDPAVITVGARYLEVVAINFVASALVVTTTTTFQGLGHTVPPLLSSVARLVLFAGPLVWMRLTGRLQLDAVWWLWVVTIFLQAAVNLLLLWREFPRQFDRQAEVVAAVEPIGD